MSATPAAEHPVLEERYTLGSKLSERAGIRCHFGLDAQSCEPVTIWTFAIGPKAYVEAFLKEAHTLAMVSHPGLLEVLSSGRVDGRAYVVTADGEGLSLARMLERGSLIPLEQRRKILSQVAGALHAAWASGFAHGSFGPDSIILGSEGEAIVRGVGLERLSRALKGVPEEGPWRAAVAADQQALDQLWQSLLGESAPQPKLKQASSPAPRPMTPKLPPPMPLAASRLPPPPPLRSVPPPPLLRSVPPPPPTVAQGSRPPMQKVSSVPPRRASVPLKAVPEPRLPYPSILGSGFESEELSEVILRPKHLRWLDGLASPAARFRRQSTPGGDLLRVAAMCALIFVTVAIVSGAAG